MPDGVGTGLPLSVTNTAADGIDERAESRGRVGLETVAAVAIDDGRSVTLDTFRPPHYRSALL